MKICFISDTHTLETAMEHDIPSCDVLVHSGDLTNNGKLKDVKDFSIWLDSIEQAKHKIIIAGNHDFCFETRNVDNITAKKYINEVGIYLQDSSVTIDGVKFYGSPWQPEFCSWAFNLPRNGPALEACWDQIPEDTDILITHGPPKGILDICPNGYSAGCEKLLERLRQLDIPIHCFGHIHEGYGILNTYSLDTTFVNAATCTGMYEPFNKPILVDYHPEIKVVNVLQY